MNVVPTLKNYDNLIISMIWLPIEFCPASTQRTLPGALAQSDIEDEDKLW